MTPIRLRLLALSFLATAAAISGNAIYLQKPPQLAGTAISETNDKVIKNPSTASLPRTIATAKNQPSHVYQSSTSKKIDKVETAIDLESKQNKYFSVEVVRAIERELVRKGYNPGEVNGNVDNEMRAAIIAYEFDEGLPLKGEPSEEILKSLIFGASPGKLEPVQIDRFEHKQELVAQVQNRLAELGYMTGPLDGRFDNETRDAIRRFEHARGLPEEGRLTSRILIELVVATNGPLKIGG